MSSPPHPSIVNASVYSVNVHVYFPSFNRLIGQSDFNRPICLCSPVQAPAPAWVGGNIPVACWVDPSSSARPGAASSGLRCDPKTLATNPLTTALPPAPSFPAPRWCKSGWWPHFHDPVYGSPLIVLAALRPSYGFLEAFCSWWLAMASRPSAKPSFAFRFGCCWLGS